MRSKRPRAQRAGETSTAVRANSIRTSSAPHFRKTQSAGLRFFCIFPMGFERTKRTQKSAPRNFWADSKINGFWQNELIKKQKLLPIEIFRVRFHGIKASRKTRRSRTYAPFLNNQPHHCPTAAGSEARGELIRRRGVGI